MTKANKKKEIYKQTFKKGVFLTDRPKAASWVSDKDVWMEIVNAGANSDDTEFVTIKFNNIKRVKKPWE